jgi:hypothetical protein
MAEQFLSRLNQIEASIEGLGETLKRMITVLGAITEIKSEVTQAKTEILSAIAEMKSTEAPPAVDQAAALSQEFETTFKTELENLRSFVESSMDSLMEEVSSAMESSPAPTPVPVAASPSTSPAPDPAASMIPAATSSLPADKSMKIADQLTTILKSLKMGCKSGDVQDTMAGAKDEILKIVPSDPVMIRIDKWVGVVASYPKRKELQARDILKLKKEIKAEIETYSLA